MGYSQAIKNLSVLEAMGGMQCYTVMEGERERGKGEEGKEREGKGEREGKEEGRRDSREGGRKEKKERS